MKKVIIGLALLISLPSQAARFWTGDLQDWQLSLNNGVAYVTSPSLPTECKYSRAQLEFSDSEYNKAMWSYLLAASKTNEKLKVVLDHDQNAAAGTVTCVIHSASATK